MDSRRSKKRGTAPLWDTEHGPLLMLRCPTNSLDFWQRINALPLDRVLSEVTADSLFLQALSIASPTLGSVVQKWKEQSSPISRKAVLKAVAYAVRMSTRPTPFGLFATITPIRPSCESRLRLGGRESIKTASRLDMGCLIDVMKKVEESSQHTHLTYFANPYVRQQGNRLFVVDISMVDSATHGGETLTKQRPVTLKATAQVQFVRKKARGGIRLADLIDSLQREFSASVEASRAFVEHLVRAGVICSELRPSPCINAEDFLLDRLEAAGISVACNLRRAITARKALESKPVTARTADDYCVVESALSEITSFKGRPVLHVDATRPLEGDLPRSVVADARFLGELHLRSSGRLSLSRYRERFINRYEGETRLVPLLEITDDDVGLGVPDSPTFESTKATAAREAFLMERLAESLANRTPEIVIQDNQIDVLFPPIPDDAVLPHGVDVGFEIHAGTTEDLARGDYLITPGGFIASVEAGASASRFSSLFDRETVEQMVRIAKRRDSHELLHAELVFAPPWSRGYNVSMRPSVLETEIRIGVHGSSIQELDPHDLFIGLDRNRFFIWSSRLRREIRVREGHLYRTTGLAPNICRLLSIISQDGRYCVRDFQWGAASLSPVLPRLRYRKTVISPASWRISLSENAGRRSNIVEEVGRFRKQWEMPRYVYLIETDQHLALDLESPTSLDLLRDQIAHKTEVRFAEMLTTPGRAWLQDIHGREYIGEFVASFRCRDTGVAVKRKSPAEATPRHLPGARWTYLRLYGNRQLADILLRQDLPPLLTALRDLEMLDSWFFIRYASDAPHIRLRLAAKSGKELALLERAIREAHLWQASGLIEKFSIETYEPEIERYGGLVGMPEHERVFNLSSEVVLQMLRVGLPNTAVERVRLAAVSAAALFELTATPKALLKDSLAPLVPRKMDRSDHNALRNLQEDVMKLASGFSPIPVSIRDTIPSVLHLHCNRAGVTGREEGRVMQIVRAMAMSALARI